MYSKLKIMNKYIIMQAVTGSPNTAVSFGMVEHNDERLAYYKRLHDALILLNETEGVNALTVYSDNVTFCESFGDAEQIDFGDEARVVEIDDDKLSKFVDVDESLKYGQMIFGLEEIKFNQFGKYTDDEFWCSVKYTTLFGW